jgi:hypothetical protein
MIVTVSYYDNGEPVERTVGHERAGNCSCEETLSPIGHQNKYIVIFIMGNEKSKESNMLTKSFTFVYTRSDPLLGEVKVY